MGGGRLLAWRRRGQRGRRGGVGGLRRGVWSGGTPLRWGADVSNEEGGGEWEGLQVRKVELKYPK